MARKSIGPCARKCKGRTKGKFRKCIKKCMVCRRKNPR